MTLRLTFMLQTLIDYEDTQNSDSNKASLPLAPESQRVKTQAGDHTFIMTLAATECRSTQRLTHKSNWETRSIGNRHNTALSLELCVSHARFCTRADMVSIDFCNQNRFCAKLKC